MLASIEERLDELHIHQVGAAQIRVVDDEDVAFAEIGGAIDHGLRRELHRPDENRQSQLALSDQFAGVACIDSVRPVEAFGNDGAERRANEGQVHFIADLLQAVLNDRERDRIEPSHVGSFPTLMMMLPDESMCAWSLGSITVVASNCSMIAGPDNCSPTDNCSR